MSPKRETSLRLPVAFEEALADLLKVKPLPKKSAAKTSIQRKSKATRKKR